jgi:hypothetical protein
LFVTFIAIFPDNSLAISIFYNQFLLLNEVPKVVYKLILLHWSPNLIILHASSNKSFPAALFVNLLYVHCLPKETRRIYDPNVLPLQLVPKLID